MKNSDFEKNIGIECFFTSKPGIDGKLRTVPHDFIVKEIFSYPEKKDDGYFTIAEVFSKNWETHKLVNHLSNRLHISRKRIGFAGTKDKRSCSTRLMSFKDVTIEELYNININDVKIKYLYNSNKSIKIGDLHGNSFDIIIRNIDNNVTKEQVHEIEFDLDNQDGFPNFYGIQRFGVIRPITHIIGKKIVQGEFEKAVMYYIANPMEGENKESYDARAELENTHDFSQALKSYPNSLNFEKAILNKLVVNPKNYIEALKELPTNLLTMFINAYQSYLFNRVLSERIKRKIPLNHAIIGDIILPYRYNEIEQPGIIVRDSNIDKVNKQIKKGKAFTSGILIGNDPFFADGEMGEIEHSIFEKEKIDHRDFVITEIPFISSSGSRRSLLARYTNMYWKIAEDELNKEKQLLNIKFDLLKGCYATSILREFMKSKDVRNY